LTFLCYTRISSQIRRCRWGSGARKREKLPDEEMERKRLQKLKLVKKDKIAQRLSRQ
jgi:hypothetical protein